MKTPLHQKSSVQTIKKRFDDDVDYYSNLNIGQKSVVDAPLILELISELSVKVVPHAKNILDIGCGGGNNTIKILRKKAKLNCDLVDISLPMLQRAKERLEKEDSGIIRVFQGDFRTLDLPENHYDIIVAAAVLHHLRDNKDWTKSFSKIHSLLKHGGAFFVSDIFSHENKSVHNTIWEHYGKYLISIEGKEYKEKVFSLINAEDSPRSMTYQIELAKKVGFRKVDILHKNSCFGAYMAIK